MKAKLTRGKGFRGVLNYIFDVGSGGGKKQPEVVGGSMAGTTAERLAREFGAVRHLRPEIERPVWHCSLSLPEGERLESLQWNQVASDFMEWMGLDERHGYVAVRHSDTEYDHVHIVACRVGVDSEVWHGRWDVREAIAATQELEEKYGLTRTVGLEKGRAERKAPSGKETHKAERTGEEALREKLQRLVDEAVERRPGALEFARELEARGVSVRPNIAGTGRMNGFSFGVEGITFKGSSLGKNYTWSRLQKRGVSYEVERDSEGLQQLRESKRAGVEPMPVIPESDRKGAVEQSEIEREMERTARVLEGTFAPGAEPTEEEARAGVEERRARFEVQQTPQVSEEERQQVRSMDPSEYLESQVFEVVREGRHLSVRFLDVELYRVTQRAEGHWVSCRHTGEGIGDNIALVQALEPGTSFVEAVRKLQGVGPARPQSLPEAEPKPKRDPPVLPEYTAGEREAGRRYLEQRGISAETLEGAEESGFLSYGKGAVLYVGRDAEGTPQSITRRAIAAADPVPKRDLKGSDKRYAPVLRGDPERVYLVEGGADALAVQELRKLKGNPAPTAIVTGGSNVLSWAENPEVQQLLKQAQWVGLLGENEKDAETQARTDAAHDKQARRVSELTGREVVRWKPPPGQKDAAEMLEQHVAAVRRQRQLERARRKQNQSELEL